MTPLAPTPGTARDVPWRVADAIWAILAGIAAAVFAALVTGEDPTATQIFLVILPAQQAGTLAALVVLSQMRGTGNLWWDLDVSFPRRAWLLVPVGIAAQVALAWLVTVFADLDEAPQEIARLTSEADGLAAFVAFAFTVAVVPFVEEAVFRGVLLHSLARRLPDWAAIAISAAAFAIFHITSPDSLVIVLPLFVLGLGLGYVAQRNLGYSIVLHSSFNLLPAIVLLAV